MNVDKVFIIHYKKLIERREYIETVLNWNNVFFIDDYDRDTVSNELINKFYDFDNEKLWTDRVINLYKDNIPFRNLKMSEICNSLSHIKVLDLIIESKVGLSLILEDDVLFKNEFFRDFDINLENTPKDFDLVFMGSSFTKEILDNVGCESNRPPISLIKENVYEKNRNPKTRTVDAYLITYESALKIRSIIDKISLPYDFDLAYFIKELDLKVYWWEPGLVYQGSMTGQYKSSIR